MWLCMAAIKQRTELVGEEAGRAQGQSACLQSAGTVTRLMCFTSDAAILCEGPAALCQLVQLLVLGTSLVFVQQNCYGHLVTHQRRDHISPKGGGPTAALYDWGAQLTGLMLCGCLSAASVRGAALGGRSAMLLAACL